MDIKKAIEEVRELKAAFEKYEYDAKDVMPGERRCDVLMAQGYESILNHIAGVMEGMRRASCSWMQHDSSYDCDTCNSRVCKARAVLAEGQLITKAIKEGKG